MIQNKSYIFFFLFNFIINNTLINISISIEKFSYSISRIIFKFTLIPIKKGSKNFISIYLFLKIYRYFTYCLYFHINIAQILLSCYPTILPEKHLHLHIHIILFLVLFLIFIDLQLFSFFFKV